MRNIFRIFFSDIRALFSNFFAVVIMGAVLILPALYAWVNIYANWDPYANTGNVKIALASADAGYTTEDGDYVNIGQEIMEELAASTSIAWTIESDPDTAIARVEDGTYYGALIMGENLSRNMYELTEALRDKEPSIVFYQNAKTNAIANKITTTASNTAKHNIQVKYLSVLIQNLFEQLDGYLEEFDAEQTLDDLIALLTKLRDALKDYSYMIANMSLMDSDMVNRLEGAKDVSRAKGILNDAAGSVGAAAASLEETRADMQERAIVIQDALNDLANFLNGLDGQALTGDMLDAAIERIGRAESLLEFMRQALPADGSGTSGVAVTARTLDTMIARLKNMQQELDGLRDAAENGMFVTDITQRLARDARALEGMIANDLAPAIDTIFDGIARDVQILYKILESVNLTVDQIPPTVTAAQSTIAALQSTMRQLITFLNDGSASLTNLIERLEEARDNDTLTDLIDMLHGDPAEFADFLSAPVEVVTTTIYPVENYGSGMAPFYSTLAIWVGGVVIAAIIKPEASKKRLRRPTEGQLYWGRLLIYLLVGQIQAAIIIWGDLHILGCQCLEPKLLYMTASVTSVIFVTLIYSLILAFGDIGKAIMVVIMVLQIAGSSGSYPIEILPEIFSGMYLFFPFPYAINAMRETMCGMYRYDLYRYLGELLLFGVAAVLIGLVVRRPFIKVNKFIEEEMEETGVL